VKACLDVFCPGGNWIEEVVVVVVGRGFYLAPFSTICQIFFTFR
jgi:hypothetical protein